jgi:hypothetical protein
MRIKPAILIAAASVLALSGCNTASKALGLAKVTPDEFRIVTKAPLVVPPDYALRPPAPGEPRPQELQPDSAARAVLVGQVQAADRSAGENRFVARAGAAQPDPLIRFVVDDENQPRDVLEEGRRQRQCRRHGPDRRRAGATERRPDRDRTRGHRQEPGRPHQAARPLG